MASATRWFRQSPRRPPPARSRSVTTPPISLLPIRIAGSVFCCAPSDIGARPTTSAIPIAVIAENNEFLVLIARSLPACEHSRSRTGGLQERAVSVCCWRLLGCGAELERLGFAQQVALGYLDLRPDIEQTLRELGIRGVIIKTMRRAMTGVSRDPSSWAAPDDSHARSARRAAPPRRAPGSACV